MITAPVQDRFVPQAANWDVLGGVNFQKGCYTGQEIVARTQYLGRLKERLFAFHAPSTTVAPGRAPVQRRVRRPALRHRRQRGAGAGRRLRPPRRAAARGRGERRRPPRRPGRSGAGPAAAARIRYLNPPGATLAGRRKADASPREPLPSRAAGTRLAPRAAARNARCASRSSRSASTRAMPS